MVRIPADNVGEYEKWGAFDLAGAATPYSDIPIGGFYFAQDGNAGASVSGATPRLLRIVHHDGTTITTMGGYNETALNGDVTQYIIDGNVHTYEIMYSQSAAYFFVDDTYLGKIDPTTTPFPVMDLPVSAIVHNSDSGDITLGQKTLEVWSNSILRMGKGKSTPVWKYITSATATGILKQGAGILLRVLHHDQVLTGAGSLILYDDVSAVDANTIATVDLTKKPCELDMGVTIQTGLFYVLSGEGKVTVIYE
jgi:hypothetical protein